MGLFAGLAFTGVAGEWKALVLPLLVTLVLHPWIPWRYSTTARLQRRLFAWLGAPFLLMSLLRMIGSRSTIDTSLGLAVLGTVYVMCCAILELYRRQGQARPEVYHMGIMTVMMVGGISSRNLLYPAFLVLYFILAVALLRHPFGGWWGRQGPPPSRAPLGGVVLAFLLAFPLAYMARAWLPNVGRVFVRLYSQGLLTNPLGEAQLFGATSSLHSIQRMEASRAVVARVYGPNTQLRGQVYVDYERGQWSAPIKAERRVEFKAAADGWITLPGPAPETHEEWTIAPVKDVIGQVPLPSGAYRIHGISELRLDSYDALLGDTIEPYRVVASDRCDERSPTRIEPTSQEYLRLPPELSQALLDWSNPIVEPGNEANSLWRYLAEHGHYDPTARRPPDRDPVLAFLESGMHGHCELFASTLALTLRARGIPTRYVVGFQLAEKNPWGGYYIVRDRDAHAWVEAYVNGRWLGLDPTPSAQFEATHPDGDHPDLLDGLMDALKSLLAAALSWLRRARLPAWLLVATTLSPLVWLILRHPRRWAALWRKAARLEPEGQLLAGLEARLQRIDVQRRSSETVLEFADRLRLELDPGSSAAYADWLHRYSRVRFGGQGGLDALAQELNHLPAPRRRPGQPARDRT